MSWQLGSFALLALALGAGFAWYERARPDARIVALVGTLAAFAALGRVAFAAVPNVKPTTDIVLVGGYALGGGPGFAIGALAALSSNFFFGQGPWTPWQMAGWGATGVIGAGLAWLVGLRPPLLGRLLTGRRGGGPDAPRGAGAGARRATTAPPPLGRWPLAAVCAVVGFAFTALQDVGDWVTYSDHSLGQLGVYVGQGLGFDAVHAAGCVAFALAIGPALTRSIQRFARRLEITWVSPPGAAAALWPVLAVAAGATAAAWTAAQAPPARAAALSPPALIGSVSSYLRSAQNADGGFGPAPGQASDQLYSGWAALGLAAAGQDLNQLTRGGGNVVGYVQASAGAPSDTGALERTLLVAGAAGAPGTSFGGHDLVAALEQRLRRDGSWSDQVNWTAFGVLALRAAGTAPDARTLGWLVRQQDGDGGFSFAGAGGGSDVDDTGAVLEALAGDGGAGAVRARAVAYLRAQQDRDGGFPSQPGSGSNAQSTAWAIQGLIAAGVSPQGLHRGGAPSPVAYLDSLVAPSGLVRYSRGLVQTPVWVTGEALMAMEGKPLPIAAPPPGPTAPAAPRSPAAAPSSRPHASTSARRAGAAPRAGHHRRRAAHRRRARSGHRQARGRTGSAVAAALLSGPLPTVRAAGTAGVIAAVVLAPLGLS